MTKIMTKKTNECLFLDWAEGEDGITQHGQRDTFLCPVGLTVTMEIRYNKWNVDVTELEIDVYYLLGWSSDL